MLTTKGGHLDFRFRTEGFVVRVMEKPGAWLEPDQQEDLLNSLQQVGAKVLGGKNLNYGVFSGGRHYLENALVTLVRDQAKGAAVAFNVMPLLPVPLHGKEAMVHHLGLAMVDPEVQGRGLTWVLYGLTSVLIVLKNRFRPIWISNVTQVPSVMGKVCEGYRDVFPKPGSPRPSFEQLCLARGIMALHRSFFGVGPEAGFDEKRFVITNSYTGGSDNLKKTFEQAPKHRDEAVNVFCGSQLDYVRGDDFLQIGRFDLPGVRQYLLRDVPPRSLLGLGISLAALLLAGLVLPLLHWFDTKTPYGELRPR